MKKNALVLVILRGMVAPTFSGWLVFFYSDTSKDDIRFVLGITGFSLFVILSIISIYKEISKQRKDSK